MRVYSTVFTFDDGKIIKILAGTTESACTMFKNDYHTYIPVGKLIKIQYDHRLIPFSMTFDCNDNMLNFEKINLYLKAYSKKKTDLFLKYAKEQNKDN